MRLIDADVLLSDLEELFKARINTSENRTADVTWNDAICAIKSAPTIQPTEE